MECVQSIEHHVKTFSFLIVRLKCISESPGRIDITGECYALIAHTPINCVPNQMNSAMHCVKQEITTINFRRNGNKIRGELNLTFSSLFSQGMVNCAVHLAS